MNAFPPVGETWKAAKRRAATGWFEKYAPWDRPGLDIGPDRDPLNHTFRRWNFEKDGDATYLTGVPSETFDTVYASHVLEHLKDPIEGLKNWYRVLRPGGHLIVCLPDRDRYEKRTKLPSRWNPDHKTFWLLDKAEPPCTRSLVQTLKDAIPEGEIVSLTVLDDGFVDPGSSFHSHGEYSFEAIIKKPVITT